jgi:hypothetical protein
MTAKPGPGPTWKKRLWRVGVLLGVYVVAYVAFTRQSEGLITAEGSVSLWPLALGVSVIGLRFVGLFVVLPVCLYSVVREMGGRWIGRGGDPRS